MSAERRNDEPRVYGQRHRLGCPVDIGTWTPLSPQAAAALPPLPEPPPRPQLQRPRAEARRDEPQARPQEEPLPPAATLPILHPPRPAHLEEGSPRARAWDHAEEAAGILQGMLLAGQGAVDSGMLVVALGDEVAGEVLKHLDDAALVEIAQAVARTGVVEAEEERRVLAEFDQQLLAREWVRHGGVECARRMLDRAVGPRKGREILQRVAHTVSPGFHMLKNASPEQVAPFIDHEHPQTIALILSQVDPAQAAGILARLSQPLQADVAYRIATMESVTPAAMKDLQEGLEASLGDLIRGNQDVGGARVLAGILNAAGPQVEKGVLAAFDARDAAVAERVRSAVFTFDDIRWLSDRDVQTLLREMDQKDLVVSLKTASDELAKKILGNLSEAARTGLQQEMELLGPMRLWEVEQVQLRIVAKVRELEEKGAIAVVAPAGPDAFV